MKPKITVLMPVYNGEKYLKEAIESILSQTYTDFEFLIINDGSTDTSEQIITSYNDTRIKYVKNSKNLGFSATINKGLTLAAGEYIARMDCDDLSAPTRFEKQVEFLDKHPSYGVVGTLFALIDENRSIHEMGGVKLLGDEELKIALMYSNVFCHGETMIRKSVSEKYNFQYDPAYTPCEDYDLWVRMSKVTKFKTIPEVLYFYMVHEEGMSGKQAKRMKEMVEHISSTLREKSEFQTITIRKCISFVKSGWEYKDSMITLPHKTTILYLQLSYQVFLFRRGKLYLQKKKPSGILLFVASLLINPANWYRHLFGLFPVE